MGVTMVSANALMTDQPTMNIPRDGLNAPMSVPIEKSTIPYLKIRLFP